MSLRGWCSQQLKLLAAYLLRMYCLSCSTFSGVGAQGKIGGVDGGISRRGHEQGELACVGTPELEHLELPKAATEAGWPGGVHVPTSGKEAGSQCSN